MVGQSLSERPIFASEEQEYLTPVKPPISRLSIVSLILGLLSGLVMINSDLIALPAIAVVLGLIAYVQIARSDALSGSWLALLAVTLGILFATWSTTNLRLRDTYLYGIGSQLAEHYLEVLGQGKMLDAVELTRPEAERQVPGTSLEEYYANVSDTMKERLDGYRSDPAVKRAIELGEKADWKFARGVRIGRYFTALHVVVRMVDDSSRQAIDVTLSRDLRDKSASWFVTTANLVDPHKQ